MPLLGSVAFNTPAALFTCNVSFTVEQLQ